jgi:hypothetical protein
MVTEYRTQAYNIVDVTDIHPHKNPYPASTIDFVATDQLEDNRVRRKKKTKLDHVDTLFGPLQIGNYSVTRSALAKLGATVNGQPLTDRNTAFRVARQSFIDALQFDSNAIESRLKKTTFGQDYSIPSLLFEIASVRPPSAIRMLHDHPNAASDPDGNRLRLEKLLSAAQRFDMRRADLPGNAPGTGKWIKGAAQSGAGSGLQIFGIYNGLRGLADAINNKDRFQIVLNAASLAGEAASVTIELSMAEAGKRMIKASQMAYKDFARTTFALRVSRAGGLIGSLFTLPFDIYAAVDSFNAAANSSGKRAMDHYVGGSLSILSAAMTLGLGLAALAGFSTAGVVGIVAGAALAIGAQCYAAVRLVEDIEAFIELTVHERLRTGWFAFFGISPDHDVAERYAIAQAQSKHSMKLRTQAKILLEDPLNESTGIVVNGSFKVERIPYTLNTRNRSTGKWHGETHYKTVIKDDDDTIDAREGVDANTSGAVFGSDSDNKGVLWLIGDGYDTVTGPRSQPNTFNYGTGVNHLTGGDKDDNFVFKKGAHVLEHGAAEYQYSTLDGGPGTDTLVFDGALGKSTAQRMGYHIDLSNNRTSIITPPLPAHTMPWEETHTLLKSIENVQTLQGANNKVTGSAERNVIVSRGEDIIDAREGDDQIDVYGGAASVNGGPGADEYRIAHTPGAVQISEDGVDPSTIFLNWRADLIESWRIENTEFHITSRFDLDEKKRTVIIKSVYDQAGSLRTLKNNKLVFVTKDGYQLAPNLPTTIETTEMLEIEPATLVSGMPRFAIIHHFDRLTVPDKVDAQYFISRHKTHTIFNAEKKSESGLTSLYVDFSSHELTRVEAYYNVYKVEPLHKNSDHYRFKDCGLHFHFGTRCVSITNSANTHVPSPDSGLIFYPSMHTHHHFMLILNDGASFRGTPLPLDEKAGTDKFTDHDFVSHPTFHWTEEYKPPYNVREGKLPFLRPPEKQNLLAVWPQCLEVSAAGNQTVIESLLGNGSTYIVHLQSTMTLRISTPGALVEAHPQLSSASTWEFDASKLGDSKIDVIDNLLTIGNCIIYLPHYQDREFHESDSKRDLIDQVFVTSNKGVIYEVNLAFDAMIYAVALDGLHFTPPENNATPLPEEFAAIKEDELNVVNIKMKDGTQGSLTYNLLKRSWHVENDPTRIITYTDLKKAGRCEHRT